MKSFSQLTKQEQDFAVELAVDEIISQAVEDSPVLAILATTLMKKQLAEKSVQLAKSKTYLEKSNGDILW